MDMCVNPVKMTHKALGGNLLEAQCGRESAESDIFIGPISDPPCFYLASSNDDAPQNHMAYP